MLKQCYRWPWRHVPDGYGAVRFGKKSFLMHRVMWAGINGPIPHGMLVLHKCDTPACINPTHLFLGTYLDNNRDRMNKGRSAVGERSGRHKLRLEDVQKIRAEFDSGSTSQTKLAKEFNVSSHTVSMIVRRRIWRSV